MHDAANAADPPLVDPDSARVEDLRKDVPKRDSVESIRRTNEHGAAFDVHSFLRESRSRHVKTMQSAEINRLHQQNEMRPKLFSLAARLAWVVVLGNFAIVGWYAWHAREHTDSGVLMFWISSTVVEVLGVVYIIAQYLFPRPRKQKKRGRPIMTPDQLH